MLCEGCLHRINYAICSNSELNIDENAHSRTASNKSQIARQDWLTCSSDYCQTPTSPRFPAQSLNQTSPSYSLHKNKSALDLASAVCMQLHVIILKQQPTA